MIMFRLSLLISAITLRSDCLSDNRPESIESLLQFPIVAFDYLNDAMPDRAYILLLYIA